MQQDRPLLLVPTGHAAAPFATQVQLPATQHSLPGQPWVEAGSYLRIRVTDTGVGIDATELPHIFERFYRGSRAHEARGSGSGLGLAIVHSIVDMHGGRVAVESRVGSGSRFSVTLPRDPRLVAGSPAAEQADVASAAEAEPRATLAANMQETSPSERSQVNPNPAP